MSCEGRVKNPYVEGSGTDLDTLLEVLAVRREWLYAERDENAPFANKIDSHLNELAIVVTIINTLIEAEDE